MTLMAEPQSIPMLLRSKGLQGLVSDYEPRSQLGLTVRKAFRYLPEELALEILNALQSVAVIEASLHLQVIRGLRLFREGLIPWQEVVVEPEYLASRKVVTTVGAEFIVDAFQGTTELENMRYHAIGTGTNAEAVGNTALQTELSTEYTGNQRAQGTLTENGSTVYRTVGTNTLDSGTPAVTEHGILSQQATGGGVLLDRSQFSAINLNGTNGDGLQSTYDFTVTAGS